MYDASTTIDAFLNAAAAKQPTPGGGSIAALAGALAAAMGEMVLNYSVGRKQNAPDADQTMRAVLAEFTRARQLLLELMREDQLAYESLTAARKLSPGPEHDAQLNIALLACIRVPQAIATTGLTMLD